jgi:uroporphyrinogen decarboxylase
MSPLERAFQLQGMQAFLLNLVDAPDFAAALLRKITDLCKTHLTHFLGEVGEHLDLIILADDLGTQNSLLISPRTYRSLLKPLHAELFALVRQHSRARIFFHSDGDVFPLLDDLVEIGVQVLNPIQTSAGRMANLEELKRRYGERLVFCGAIDTQRVLPLGRPDEVRAEVKRVIETLGADGGYLLASVHTIPNETPPENILAMVDAALEFGRYI